MNKIAIVINGVMYEKEFESPWVSIEDFTSLMQDADILDEDSELRGLSEEEIAVLDF